VITARKTVRRERLTTTSCPKPVRPGECRTAARARLGWLLSQLMDAAQRDLRSYYEEEARLRLRQPLIGRRLELRNEFIGLLDAEGRRSIVDFGSGPGRDGEAFTAAGLEVVGLDLAHTNALLAAERRISVVEGSVSAPPFRQRSFDAGWSMSTLMHLRQGDVPDTLSAMMAVLELGAPLVVGVWGGPQGELVGGTSLAGHQRLFCLRPLEVNYQLFAACGAVEHTSTWDLGPDEWQYQVFRIRVDR
jgi:SAM-dependent methyltransferase